MNGYGIVVLDYEKFGKLVRDWAIDPSRRPVSNQDLRSSTEGILEIPNKFSKSPLYAQATEGHPLITLPSKEFIYEVYQEPKILNNPKYPLPKFYTEIVEGNIYGEKALLSRFADRSIVDHT